MPQVSRKVLWGSLAAILVLIVAGLFFLYHNKSTANTCNGLLYEPLKKHLQKNAINQFKGDFYNVWVTKHFFMTTECSYFSMKPDGLSMQGFHNKTEDPHNTYAKFVQRSTGVIDIHPENDANATIGRIYPVFAKDFVLGNVFCEENQGKPQWKAAVSVDKSKLKNPKTPSLISQATQLFQTLGAEVGLDLGLGESYVTPCVEEPQWRDETKN